jgi:hypothetical protein
MRSYCGELLGDIQVGREINPVDTYPMIDDRPEHSVDDDECPGGITSRGHELDYYSNPVNLNQHRSGWCVCEV